jgi:hypothetical protein
MASHISNAKISIYNPAKIYSPVSQFEKSISIED